MSKRTKAVAPRNLFLSKTFILLLFLFIAAFLLRIYRLSDNLFFGPEQGRDLLVVRDIVLNHNMTLIGPSTDIPGIFHGPIFTYLATIPFIISNGDPVFTLQFFILLHSLGVFIIYFLGRELWNERVGLVSAAIYVVSYGAIVSSRWLSHPPLSIFLASLFFLFLIKFLKGKRFYLLFASAAFGLLGQAEFVNYLFFGVLVLIIVFLYRKEFFRQRLSFLLLAFLVLCIFSVGNYVLFDLRNNFLISKNILLSVSGGGKFPTSLTDSAVLAISGLFNNFVFYVSPFFPFIGVILLFSCIYVLVSTRKSSVFFPVLLLWLVVTPIILILLRHVVLHHYFVGSVVALILLTAILIDFFWEKRFAFGVFLLGLILFINLLAWIKNVPDNNNMFFQVPQPHLHYSYQREAIDSIYADAKGAPFSIQAYTIPYWLQEGWEYLFWQYGRQKYGYEPVKQGAKKLFVIIQDDPNNMIFQNPWIRDTVSKWGEFVQEKRFGILRVRELRVP